MFNAIVRKLAAPPIDIMLGSRQTCFSSPTSCAIRCRWAADRWRLFTTSLSCSMASTRPAEIASSSLATCRPTIKKSQHLIAVSQNAKDEIVSYYGTDPNKITVINPAINHDLFNPRPQHETDAIAKKYAIVEPYILYTGTLEPRKNIAGILNAYTELPPNIRDSFSLVLAGGKGWLDREIKAQLDALEHLDVIVTGYVPDGGSTGSLQWRVALCLSVAI